MARRKQKSIPQARRPKNLPSGFRAKGSPGKTIVSHAIGVLPIITRLLERMRLVEFLRQHLAAEDRRTRVDTPRVVTLLLCNLLVSREPMYGVAEWASRFGPELFDLYANELESLNDDRVGRCLDRLCDALSSNLILDVVRQVVKEFDLSLDELHNDSTTISFFGDYEGAETEQEMRGRTLPAITWGFSKDHRPDLKQLLYILTVSDDGGVPVYFQASSGNTVDDQTHQATWQVLRELVGRPDFVYVADCKLATTENMNFIARQGGRFITVLPATRQEDAKFRRRVCEHPELIRWREVHRVIDDEGQLRDVFRVCEEESVSAEGYRLFWYHSRVKQEQDGLSRARRTQRAIQELSDLRQRLVGPRTRFRQREKVVEAVQEILDRFGVQAWLPVDIETVEQEIFHQTKRGRPTQDTQYTRHVNTRYLITWQVDPRELEQAALGDGIFPLISNICDWDAGQILQGYKRQPIIEKRFSQLKTDFGVAPVYLKNVGRIVGLLAVYFFALMVQTLLERELRQAMLRHRVDSLPLYPEGRPCRRPTTRRVIDLFEPIQCHSIPRANGEDEIYVTELCPLQRQILKLLRIPAKNYGL